VNTKYTRERHFDGTALISGADGIVFKSLAPPDLSVTDAERPNVIGGDTALIGIRILLDSLILLSNLISRYYNHFFAFFPTSTSSCKHARSRSARIAGPALRL
jgi:hypothetical protein